MDQVLGSLVVREVYTLITKKPPTEVANTFHFVEILYNKTPLLLGREAVA